MGDDEGIEIERRLRQAVARRSQQIGTDVASPALLTQLSVADWLSLVAIIV